MRYTVKVLEETINLIQNQKNTNINVLTLWFENDYIIEINKKNFKTILYEFEPCTEQYHYKGEYLNLMNDLKKGYIKYGKKHKFLEMDVVKDE